MGKKNLDAGVCLEEIATGIRFCMCGVVFNFNLLLSSCRLLLCFPPNVSLVKRAERDESDRVGESKRANRRGYVL